MSGNAANGHCRAFTPVEHSKADGGNINRAPSVNTRQGSKSPSGGSFGDTTITCTCPQTFGNIRFWNVQGLKPAGRASTGWHSRPRRRDSVPARGGSHLQLPAPATSGREAGAGDRRKPGRAPRPRPGRLGARPRLPRPRPLDPGPEGELPFTCSPLWLPPPPPPRRSPKLPGELPQPTAPHAHTRGTTPNPSGGPRPQHKLG